MPFGPLLSRASKHVNQECLAKPYSCCPCRKQKILALLVLGPEGLQFKNKYTQNSLSGQPRLCQVVLPPRQSSCCSSSHASEVPTSRTWSAARRIPSSVRSSLVGQPEQLCVGLCPGRKNLGTIILAWRLQCSFRPSSSLIRTLYIPYIILLKRILTMAHIISKSFMS